MNQPAHWKAKPDHADYDEMRSRLIAAAWDMACEQGVTKLTLNGVAKRADCARSSVYRYFDSKEQLLGAVVSDRILFLGKELESSLKRFRNPREQIVQGVYQAVEVVKHGPSLELFKTFAAEEGQEVSDLLIGQVPELAERLLRIDPVFRRARDTGQIRDGLSDEEILRWLLTIAFALIQQASFGQNRQRDLAYLRKMLIPSIFKDG